MYDFTDEEVLVVCEHIAKGDKHKLEWLLSNKHLVRTLMIQNAFLNKHRQPNLDRQWYVPYQNRVSDELQEVFGERKLFGFAIPRCFMMT